MKIVNDPALLKARKGERTFLEFWLKESEDEHFPEGTARTPRFPKTFEGIQKAFGAFQGPSGSLRLESVDMKALAINLSTYDAHLNTDVGGIPSLLQKSDNRGYRL